MDSNFPLEWWWYAKAKCEGQWPQAHKTWLIMDNDAKE